MPNTGNVQEEHLTGYVIIVKQSLKIKLSHIFTSPVHSSKECDKWAV